MKQLEERSYLIYCEYVDNGNQFSPFHTLNYINYFEKILKILNSIRFLLNRTSGLETSGA